MTAHPTAVFHLWESDITGIGPSCWVDHNGIYLAPAFPPGSKVLGTGPVEIR